MVCSTGPSLVILKADCLTYRFFYSFDMVHFGHANALRQVGITNCGYLLRFK